MKNVLLMLGYFTFTATCSAQNETLQHLLKDSLGVIKKRVERIIIPARYMEGKLLLETDTLNGWKGFKVKLYEYKFSKTTPKTKVYMLNANSDQIAKWIISACYTVTGKLSKKHTDMLIDSTWFASGGQFPVKGTVYENEGEAPYFFKDGVTVFLSKKAKHSLSEHTADTLAVINDSNITSGKFGRIISTTRKQYKLNGGKENTDGLNWLKVVRREYQKALSSDNNNLVTAWARQNLK
jgi:hypothetical protein